MISAITAWASVVGNGTTGPFSVPFPLYKQSHLKLILDNNGTISTLALGTDYTFSSFVQDNKNQCQSPAITFVNNTIVGATYVFLLNLPLTQLTDISNFSQYFPQLHEQEMDMLDQGTLMMNERINKSIKAPDAESSSQVNFTLPLAALRAGALIGFDAATGNNLVMVTSQIPQANVTAFWQNVLSKPDIYTSTIALQNSVWSLLYTQSTGTSFNDYSFGGNGVSFGFIALTCIAGNSTLTGMLAPTLAVQTCQKTTFYNFANSTLTLKHDNNSSQTQNRFYCPGNTDYVMSAYTSVELVYSQQLTRWVVVP